MMQHGYCASVSYWWGLLHTPHIRMTWRPVFGCDLAVIWWMYHTTVSRIGCAVLNIEHPRTHVGPYDSAKDSMTEVYHNRQPHFHAQRMA